MQVILEKEDRVISEFLQSMGPWGKYVVIGGGFALLIYKLYLADEKHNNPPAGTRDIDSLIPRKLPTVSAKNIFNYLVDAGFKVIFKDLEDPAAQAYVKEIEGLDVEIEFLTDNAVRESKDKNVTIAGIIAQPLRYLKLSLQKSVEFRTLTNEVGRVVSPGAWIFHKGLTFPRRKNKSKFFKDLYGIWYVATQLGDFSDNALIELEALFQQNPKWSKTFRENLQGWLKGVVPEDWDNLEMQDPFGRLKKLGFERTVTKILTLVPPKPSLLSLEEPELRGKV